MPKGVRLKPEQVVAKLREIEVKLSQGKDVLTACREAGATSGGTKKLFCRFCLTPYHVTIRQSATNYTSDCALHIDYGLGLRRVQVNQRGIRT
jgi:hypothetical protein